MLDFFEGKHSSVTERLWTFAFYQHEKCSLLIGLCSKLEDDLLVMRGNGLKLHRGRLRLDIRNKFFSETDQVGTVGTDCPEEW